MRPTIKSEIVYFNSNNLFDKLLETEWGENEEKETIASNRYMTRVTQKFNLIRYNCYIIHEKRQNRNDV